MTLAAVTRTALVIASAVAGASCISGAEPSETSSQAIVGGDADTSDDAVVALLDTANGSLCSGTLIAPSLVLTAAHCVDGIAASDLQVLVGGSTSAPDQTVSVTSAVSYPTYTSEQNGIPGGVDLGYVTLASALAITPVVVDTTTTDAQLTGATVTVVGYGVTDGTDDTGSGTRRAVTLSVSSVCSRIIQAGTASANACVGDSGGAVLLGGRLVAVVSGGDLGCESPTNFMRTDAHATWIGGLLAGSDAATCSACVGPDPSCTAATETKPAGVVADASPGGEDAGEVDSGPPKSSPGGGGGGGCRMARDARPEDGALPALLMLVAWVGLRRRRPAPLPRRAHPW